MGWWPFQRRERGLGEPPDYFREGINLANERRYHEALTSFRLALRRTPDDARIMEQMAVVYSQIGMPEEAIKFYNQAMMAGDESPAAHYGLAFLYLKKGVEEEARRHLRAFLDRPPEDQEAARHIEHARKTLRELETEERPAPGPENQIGG